MSPNPLFTTSTGALTRRTLLATAGQAVVAATAFGQTGGDAAVVPLRQLAKARGLIYGAAILPQVFPKDRAYEALAARECGLFACSRAHWDEIAPTPDKALYAPIDLDFAWAFGKHMEFLAQGLVWHERPAPWFKDLPDRAAAIKAVKDFSIKTCQHFAGRVYAWIVVNEAIQANDGRPDGLRNSIFMQKIGPDYIDLTFQAAREGDPKAKLVYNDYDLELDIDFQEDRRKSLLLLLDGFKKRNTPVDIIGLQSHLRASLFPRHFNERVLSRLLDEIASRGYEIQLSELDVIDKGAPSDIARRDADVATIYRRFLDVALAHKAVKSVVTWGITDRYTWVGADQYADTRRTDGLPPRPLPFDADYKPKPAYTAMAQAFTAAPPR